MLENQSVTQVLRVLELLRQNKRLGFDTVAACSRAIQQVAKESGVRYQTIGDGCRRRLGLTDMSEFHRLAEAWLRGDGSQLATVVKRSSNSSERRRIDEFFANSRAASPRVEEPPRPSPNPAPIRPAKPIQITLDESAARML